MWLRRALFHWLVPAAFLLPAWLLMGWFAFDANGWALVGTLLIVMPSVFVGQLLMTLLVRSRGSVRTDQAVSWWDVAGFGLWHTLIVALGLYTPGWFWAALAGAVLAFLALFWTSLWQLIRETRISVRAVADGSRYLPDEQPRPSASVHDVIVISETPPATDR